MFRAAARVRCAAIALLLLVLASCATPDAVRNFVVAARGATLHFSPFVKDIAQSCVRRKLADRPVTEIEDASAPAAAACKEDFDLAPGLEAAMDVLGDYFKALEQLASKEAVTFDKQTDELAGKVKAAAGLPAPAGDAVKGLAKFVVDAATAGYQRKKLAAALQAADPHVAALTNALGRIVGVDYVRDLANEEDTLRNRYRDAMRADQRNDAVALLLQREWARDLAMLQKKKGAAADFQKALEKIRDGHKQLAARGKNWSAAELVQQLGPYTDSLQTLGTRFEGAFL